MAGWRSPVVEVRKSLSLQDWTALFFPTASKDGRTQAFPTSHEFSDSIAHVCPEGLVLLPKSQVLKGNILRGICHHSEFAYPACGAAGHSCIASPGPSRRPGNPAPRVEWLTSCLLYLPTGAKWPLSMCRFWRASRRMLQLGGNVGCQSP